MNYNWDLTKLYKSEDLFYKDIESIKEIGNKLSSYQGKLHNEKDFVDYFVLSKDMNKLINKLYMYAASKSDLNKKDVKASQDLAKVELAVRELGEKLAFENPEVLAIGETKVKDFIAKNDILKEYDYSFEQLFHNQEHILSSDKEKLLNYTSSLNQGGDLYSTLSVADFTPSEVSLKDGNKVKVNMSNWINLIKDAKSEEDRMIIFKGLYSYYEKHKVTYAQIYNLVLQSELATMKARNYSSILEEHLFSNKIPCEVFYNLIKTAKEGSTPLKKYYKLRKEYLHLENHSSFDRFLELAKSDKKYTYEQARDLFFDSIKHFPDDFQQKAHEVLKEGYVDVYPKDGKRSGAYSNGGGDIHPYILLNFDGGLDDCFTVAHEAGHSIHTLYSMENQPFTKQNYTIFVAEIASTFNEHNLLDYLLKSDNLSKQDRIFLLQKAIDEICSTFYRQTLFANYEYDIAKLVEQGQPIDHEVLSNKMIELYNQYYGIDITLEEVKKYVWAYIPHLFYTPFYVYQYATSFAASLQFYSNVKNNLPNAFEKYTSLLKEGGSDFPINEVKKAGVDFTKLDTFNAVISRMTELVDLLEIELKK